MMEMQLRRANLVRIAGPMSEEAPVIKARMLGVRDTQIAAGLGREVPVFEAVVGRHGRVMFRCDDSSNSCVVLFVCAVDLLKNLLRRSKAM